MYQAKLYETLYATIMVFGTCDSDEKAMKHLAREDVPYINISYILYHNVFSLCNFHIYTPR